MKIQKSKEFLDIDDERLEIYERGGYLCKKKIILRWITGTTVLESDLNSYLMQNYINGVELVKKIKEMTKEYSDGIYLSIIVQVYEKIEDEEEKELREKAGVILKHLVIIDLKGVEMIFLLKLVKRGKRRGLIKIEELYDIVKLNIDDMEDKSNYKRVKNIFNLMNLIKIKKIKIN
jgi:ribosomal protein L11